MPKAFCDSDYFNGYYTYEWLRIQGETGRAIYASHLKGCSLNEDSFFNTHHDGKFIKTSTSSYEWHRQDGFIYVFDLRQLKEKIDPQGNRQTLAYDGGLLSTITDEATGRVLTFHYNTEGLLDHISGPVTTAVPDGIWVSYGYDAIGNLTTVTYPDGSGRIYQYDDPSDPHNLTAELDQDGNFIYGWAYDGLDRAISNTTNTDLTVNIDYISDTTIDVTNAYGATHTFTLDTIAGQKRITAIDGPDDCVGCGEDTLRYAYNGQGRVGEVEYVNGRIDRYEDYDSRGNPQTEIRDYGGPDQVTITSVFHPTQDVPLSRTQASVLGSGDKETIWDFDDDGNETPNEAPTARPRRIIERGYTLDEGGNVTAYEYITRMEYNAKGQVTSIDGPRPGSGDTVAFEYDPVSGDLNAMTQPLVGTTYFPEYDETGNPTRIIDSNGIETVLTYDGRNRVLTATRNGATVSTSYTLAGKPDLVTDAVGRALDFQYDVNDFLERIVDPAGNYQMIDYNSVGNPTDESIFTTAGVQTKALRYDYGDPLTDPDLMAGKPWKAIRPNHDDTAELETVYGYDAMGNVSSVTDALSRTTLLQYDHFGRLECTEQPGTTVTEYDYDNQGNLISVIDPEGLETVYLYDDMGRLVRMFSPDTGLSLFLYDEAGNMVRKDHNGHVSIHVYDSANRMTNILYADGSPGVAMAYDIGQGSYLIGRLASVVDGSGERLFSYDANGNIDYEARIIDGITYMTDYQFDAAGNLRSVVYPTGQLVTYQPDSVDVGRITAVTVDPGSGVQTLADTMAYKPFGPQSAMRLGNNIQHAKGFDRNYQISSLSAGAVMNLAYTPDSVGNVAAITNHLDGSRSQSFGYDDINQLTFASGVYGSIGYTYDHTGNRTTRTDNGTTETYGYLGGTNRLDSITGTHTIYFDHDTRGNLIGRTYVDGGAPPASADIPEYLYTHDGQRVMKVVGAQETVYHYDLAGQLIAETDADGNLIKAYVWLHGAPLAMIDSGGAVYYYHNDHLGTPQRMTDGGGVVVWAADYLPFGKASVTLGGVENNLRFSGQYFDVESGLHYNYWRFYDPGLGRYLRGDPIGLRGGVNLYAYVRNDPVNMIDPYGLKTLGEYWVPVEHFFSPFVIGSASIISGAWVGTGGAVLTATSAAAVPETFGLSAIGIPAGIALVAAGEYQVMFGTTTILNHLNNLFGTDVPSLSDYSGLFPTFPSGHNDHHESDTGDPCEK